ncbi:HAD-IIB family hydrolase [Synoicihabitans lomoniglobus]|uniref:HAD hydrolase family protein n=1 Tax=Synoicihabitans lomoniglobus TaxID=2909285 RepID=A0AAF0CPS2_9BACT|nr:HAD hydrolase family protein [Opitutaceae bacterium LMO-M01]WED65813.1 HAD hydrolase family protein [Opitutaceae bacterium LMO-M01]
MTTCFDHGSPWLVFTDLDGTLLDWSNYSPAIARPAMLRLRELGVPVVFCSSKTATEQRALRQELGIRSIPSIVENGAAIIVPDSAGLPTGHWDEAPGEPGRRVLVLGLRLDEVQARLARVRARTGLPLLGYRDIDDAKLVELTGLSPSAAHRARQRDYSETLIEELPHETWNLLRDEFAAEGLECRHGGRFHTVTGAGTDKGKAVKTILELYERAYERPVKSIGLGDSANDAPLLAAVTRPFLVAREDGTWANLRIDGMERIGGRGPYGWVEAIDLILSEAGDQGAGAA